MKWYYVLDCSLELQTSAWSSWICKSANDSRHRLGSCIHLICFVDKNHNFQWHSIRLYRYSYFPTVYLCHKLLSQRRHYYTHDILIINGKCFVGSCRSDLNERLGKVLKNNTIHVDQDQAEVCNSRVQYKNKYFFRKWFRAWVQSQNQVVWSTKCLEDLLYTMLIMLCYQLEVTELMSDKSCHNK